MKIVFDVDGILCDIWTSCEGLLRSWSNEFQQGATNVPIGEYANALQYKNYSAKISKVSRSDQEFEKMLELVSFAEGFRFINTVHDFRMSDLPKQFRQFVLEALGTALVFDDPPPMYSLHNTTIDGLSAYPLADIYSHDSGWSASMTYADWGRFFMALLERGHSVTLHTHCFNNACGNARTAWFEREIKPFAPDVKLLVDIGAKKSIIEADVIVEDCLDNILAAKTKYRILRSTFHNLYRDNRNANQWKTAGSPDLVCYADNSCLVNLLLMGVERLVVTV